MMLFIFLGGVLTLGAGFVMLICTGVYELSEYIARKRGEKWMREQELKPHEPSVFHALVRDEDEPPLDDLTCEILFNIWGLGAYSKNFHG